MELPELLRVPSMMRSFATQGMACPHKQGAQVPHAAHPTQHVARTPTRALLDTHTHFSRLLMRMVTRQYVALPQSAAGFVCPPAYHVLVNTHGALHAQPLLSFT